MSHPEPIPGIVERLRNPPFADRIHMLDLHTEAADHIERLTAQNERLQLDGIHTCHDECQRTACVLRRQNAMLAEALEPFAEQADAWDPEQNDGCEFHDEDRISWDDQLTVGDLRKARTALSLIKDRGKGHG